MPESTPRTRTFLFTDYRHIQAGALQWFTPDGKPLPLHKPPEPRVEACPRRSMVAQGVRIVAQPAQKGDPLPQKIGMNRILVENGRYRLWYWSRDSMVHAVSDDGYEWEEPTRVLDVSDLGGQSLIDGLGVFVDPVAPPAERYKALYSAHPPEAEVAACWKQLMAQHPRHRDLRPYYDPALGRYASDHNQERLMCIYGAVSPDGLDWTPIPEVLLPHKSDTLTTAYYDTGLGRYVMYTRLYIHDRRWIGRAEAEDFRRWSPPEPLITPTLDDAPYDDIYTNGRTEYPGLPQYHLMFPMFYRRATEHSDVYLFSSCDGMVWDRVPDGPVITHGGPGAWDGEFIAAGTGLVPLAGDRVGVLYAGTRWPHKYPRWPHVLEAGRTAWATWPKGRLAALVADDEGEAFTFAAIPGGRELRLNARVRRGGAIRVGLWDRPGRGADDCDPIFGDDLAHPVHWRGETDIATRDGEYVILHFKMHAAEIFGFEWI